MIVRDRPIGVIVAHDKSGDDPRFTKTTQADRDVCRPRRRRRRPVTTSRDRRVATSRRGAGTRTPAPRARAARPDRPGADLGAARSEGRRGRPRRRRARARPSKSARTGLETLHAVRRLAVELRPKALDDFGLVPALERLAHSFVEQTGLSSRSKPSLARTVPERDRDSALPDRAGGADQCRQARAGAPRSIVLTVAGIGHGGHRGRRTWLRGDRRTTGWAWQACASDSPSSTESQDRNASRRRDDARRPGAHPMTIRVLIVDDHAVVRSGLRHVLDSEDGIDVVGEAADARSAIFAARARNPTSS